MINVLKINCGLLPIVTFEVAEPPESRSRPRPEAAAPMPRARFEDPVPRVFLGTRAEPCGGGGGSPRGPSAPRLSLYEMKGMV